MSPEIMLSNGEYYNFVDCDVSGVTIEVIAHALSNMCRYTGHVTRFYSVAEHSVRCSYVGPPEEALERLMHDAAECLVVDLPSPLKRMVGMEAYRQHDHNAEAVLATKFGLQYPWPPSVLTADLILLATEKRDLMPAHDPNDGRKAWDIIKDVMPLFGDSLNSFSGRPETWKRIFLARYADLKRVAA